MPKRTTILLAIVSVCLFGQGALAQQASDPSFECLSGPGPLEVISGFYDAKFKPDVTPGKRFDARGANFEMPGSFSHALVSLRGSGDNNSMCWAGGYFTTSLIWHGLDVSWDQSKHGMDGKGGVMNNTTSVTSYEDRMTWTGLHVFNMHDGIRTSNSESDWTIQHTWLDYIRDDCVENDHIYSGKIYDSLFDGCYTGISVRPSSSGHGDSQGKTITMDRVLLRMEPMPYPYKWDSKGYPLLYIEGYGGVPFGYGKVFKLDKGNVPDFRITNSVFLLEYDAGKTIFPPKDRVSVCNNNTVIWLGEPGDAPNYLLDDFPGCFTVITDRDQGKRLWKRSVADWHAKHPGVGANRKPAVPGDYNWPRYTPEGNNTPHNSAFVRQRRAMKADETGLSNPAGLTFSLRAKAFHVVKRQKPGQPPPAEAGIFKLGRFANRVDSARISVAIENPINMAFDNKANRLLIFHLARNKLIEVLERSDGNLDPTTLILHDAQHFGLQNPQGMTVDPASGHLFILDNTALQIVRIVPEPDGSFDRASISYVDLHSSGLVDARGIAFDPSTENLHVVDPGDQKLYELTQTGETVATRDLSEFELVDPQGMAFAPSRDQTDDPSQMSLYLTDSGLVAQTAAADTNAAVQTPGKIVELSFIEPLAAAASTFQSSLIQTINAWQWSPPSPDPAGIVYLPASDRLLVCDSEVNEMPIFTGDNLFEATLTGNLMNTLTTVSFSDEPTGVTLNPSNGHLFYSDDTGSKSIYEMNPGPDGQYDTADDIITSFKTGDFGSSDPEGVTFASGLGALFIADGINEEVYQLTPGANGIFDGVPPAGDDQVTSFDLTSLGALDPEGIAFNSNNGNLYVVGKPSDTLFEVTTGGALVQTIDISAANARKPAGLAYAPSSLNPNIINIYIAARGVDNDSDPDENDGKVYELTLPTSTNNPPLANDDSASTTVNMPVTIDVAANDTDPDGNLDPASANSSCGTCFDPVSGSLVNHGDGTFTYTPDSGFTGPDSFVYEICDTEPLCDTATADITVTLSNDPPVAVDDNASTSEDTLVTIDVAANDTDPDGNLDPASANSTCANGSTGCNGATNGSLTDHGDGTISYNPNQNFSGSDSFIYEICDTLGACDIATVNISINPVNDPPVAYDDSANTTEDTTVTIAVAANDTDADGNLDPTSANSTCANSSTGCNGATNGSLTDHGDGTISYNPNPNFSGSDSFIYEICDTELLCDTATADITVTISNDPPVAVDDNANTSEDTPVTIDVAANDTDPDGNLDPASANTTCATCANPANGGLLNQGDGTFSYTPDPDFNGADNYIYEICDTLGACDIGTVNISINPVNDPPVANDDSANTPEDTPVTIDVTTNDSDSDGNLDPASSNTTCGTCSDPVNGSLFNQGDGTFDYTPDIGFTGPDNFIYEICDTEPLCDTAMAAITVNPAAPMIIEVRVTASTDDAEEKVSGGMRLTSSDLELVYDKGDQTVGMRFNAVEVPQGATITSAYLQFQVDEVNTMATNLSIQGQASDAPVTFTASTNNVSARPRTVAAVSWAPVPWTTKGEAGPGQQTPDISAIIQEIVDRPGWTSGNSLVIIITGTGERTAESFDGTPSAAPLLHVGFSSGGQSNNPPLANDDSASTTVETPVTIDVAVNDTDPNGNLDPASANTSCGTCADPANGLLLNHGDGSFSYTPDPGFTGSDSFVYEICDTEPLCDTATADITVTLSNNPPVAVDDSASTTVDTPVTIDVAANDTDPNGNLDPASANTTCATCADPANGSLLNHGDGTFTYIPDPGFTGPDSFVYEICDTELLCDTATADITVTISNDPPVAVDDNANTSEDTPVTIDVAANDTDPDGNLDPASANTTCATCANPANGGLLNQGDGTFSYTPDPDFNGADNYIYEICDTLGACDIGTVNISINPVNDPPVANDDSANTPEDTPVTIDVTTNDSDSDGNLDPASSNTTCGTCSDPVNGSLFNQGDGTFDYTPDIGFTGPDNFIYEICDTEPLCDTAMAAITVNPAAPMIIEVRVTASTDDAEEKVSGGMRLTSSDLELVYDKGDQTVGMRFNAVEVPQGATITSAYLQFQVDEVNTMATNLSIQGQASDAPVTFTASTNNVSARPRTVAAVSWAPVPWTTKGEAGPGQQTPDISAIIQEIVDRPGWTSGNSLVIIITGTGERTAESFDGTPSAAPLLHVGFSSGN